MTEAEAAAAENSAGGAKRRRGKRGGKKAKKQQENKVEQEHAPQTEITQQTDEYQQNEYDGQYEGGEDQQTGGMGEDDYGNSFLAEDYNGNNLNLLVVSQELREEVDSNGGMTQNELRLICDPDCSRVLETLLEKSNDFQLRVFTDRLLGRFTDIFRHQFGSHVTQTLLHLAADIVHREVAGESVVQVAPELEDESTEPLPTMQELIIKICEELDGQFLPLMTHRYGSHVLRSLLMVLSGTPRALSNESQLRSKKSIKYATRKKVNGLGVTVSQNRNQHQQGQGQEQQQQVQPGQLRTPPSFEERLNAMVEAMCEKLTTPTQWEVLAFDAVSSPVLQLLVSIRKHDAAFVGKLLELPINDLSRHKISSHLIEKIIAVLPSSTTSNPLLNLYEKHFKGRILELCKDPVANFVVQGLIGRCCDSVQKIEGGSAGGMEKVFEGVMEECAGILSDLLCEYVKLNRPGVVVKMFQACAVFKSRQADMMKALSRSLNCSKASNDEQATTEKYKKDKKKKGEKKKKKHSDKDEAATEEAQEKQADGEQGNDDEGQGNLAECLFALRPYSSITSKTEDGEPAPAVNEFEMAAQQQYGRVGRGGRGGRPRNDGPVNYHGVMLAQAIWRFGRENVEEVAKSLVDVPQSLLKTYITSQIASHAVESFLQSATITLPWKWKLVEAMKGSFAEIAGDKYGSHFVERGWGVSPVRLKESIALELLASRQSLESSFHGRCVLRNCKIDQFASSVKPTATNAFGRSGSGANASAVSARRNAFDAEQQGVEEEEAGEVDEGGVAPEWRKKMEKLEQKKKAFMDFLELGDDEGSSSKGKKQSKTMTTKSAAKPVADDEDEMEGVEQSKPVVGTKRKAEEDDDAEDNDDDADDVGGKQNDGTKKKKRRRRKKKNATAN
ncbi:Nucleolar protein 9 [Quaeritorhiza haematococci]|nr:Nucleolar protein 9 [Quaeritorhiza haematococci]